MQPKNPQTATIKPTETSMTKWQKIITIAVLSMALLIIVIDTTVLNVSLKNIITDLNTNIRDMQWVITLYALVIAAFTITGGRLGDIFGRKKMFVVGAIVFACGSITSGLSQNIAQLGIGWSLIEGIGAALMMPATSALLVSNFKGRDRAIAYGFWGAAAGVGSALGPILGGYLTTYHTWRYAFGINVIIIIGLVIGSTVIREAKEEKVKPTLDIPGIFLSSIALASIIFGIIESSTYGWLNAKKDFEFFGNIFNFGTLSITPIAIGFGLIVLTVFIFWEKAIKKKGRLPLVNLAIFQNKPFMAGSLTITGFSLAMSGIMFIFPVYLQAVKGLDAFHTGLLFLPTSLGAFVMAPLSALLTKKITPKWIIQFGILVVIVGMYMIIQQITVELDVNALIPALLIYGSGMGLIQSQTANLTLSAVNTEEAGEASGINGTLRQFGGSLGSAIIGAVLIAALSTNAINGIKTSTIIPEPAKASISKTINDNVDSIGFIDLSSQEGTDLSTSTPDLSQLPPAQAQIALAKINEQKLAVENDMKTIINNAIVDSDKQAIIYVIIFLFLTLAISTGLPNKKPMDRKAIIAE